MLIYLVRNGVLQASNSTLTHDMSVQAAVSVPRAVRPEALPAAAPPQPSVLERVGNGAVFGLTAFFGGTFLISLATYVHNYNKPEARARRKVCSLLCNLSSMCRAFAICGACP
jgi:hypothetical protein